MKLVAVLLASIALAVPASAQAQADTVDPSVPTQLPRTAIPHHYAITVTPHADKLAFDGSVAIDLNVIEPTRDLVLNAADLSLASATLRTGNGAPLKASIRLDPKAETATLTFPRTLATGAYRLDITY
jgi:aminopeptidase N